MTAKEYLLQYREAMRRVQAVTEHLTELRAIAERITPNYSSNGGNHQAGDKIGSAVARIVDAEEKMLEEVGQLLTIKSKVEQTINSVEDDRLRMILYRRYILGEKWEQIAVFLRLDYRWVLRLHGKAMIKVQEKIDH